MCKKLALVAAFGAALVLHPQLASAQSESQAATSSQQEDAVVATVNGKEIRASALVAAVEQLPDQYRANLAAVLPVILNRLVDMELLAAAGRKQGLADDPEVMQRMAEIESQVIRNVYLERVVDQQLTDEAVEARYQEVLAENPPEPEVRARHILLQTEEDARAVIAELDGGADFVELAKSKSTGPSGPQGGDLGYFTAGAMVPEFSEAAFALEPGSYSKEPMQSQFGYHVILLEDRRQSSPPSLAVLEVQLREQMTAEAVDKEVSSLREGAEIETSSAEELQQIEGLGQ